MKGREKKERVERRSREGRREWHGGWIGKRKKEEMVAYIAPNTFGRPLPPIFQGGPGPPRPETRVTAHPPFVANLGPPDLCLPSGLSVIRRLLSWFLPLPTSPALSSGFLQMHYPIALSRSPLSLSPSIHLIRGPLEQVPSLIYHPSLLFLQIPAFSELHLRFLPVRCHRNGVAALAAWQAS